jgi:hypothetical protein
LDYITCSLWCMRISTQSVIIHTKIIYNIQCAAESLKHFLTTMNSVTIVNTNFIRIINYIWSKMYLSTKMLTILSVDMKSKSIIHANMTTSISMWILWSCTDPRYENKRYMITTIFIDIKINIPFIILSFFDKLLTQREQSQISIFMRIYKAWKFIIIGEFKTFKNIRVLTFF